MEPDEPLDDDEHDEMRGESGGVILRTGESELPSNGWYVGDGYWNRSAGFYLTPKSLSVSERPRNPRGRRHDLTGGGIWSSKSLR